MNLSVVLPIYNEEINVKKFIQSVHFVNKSIEIIAVDNNSNDNSKIEIKKTNAKYYFCKKKGYGAAIKLGLSKATKNLIVICEPDGTFKAKDIFKLLKYIKTYDCVFGTRTNVNYIYKGAKMNFLYRIGNMLVAKLMQYLFRTTNITDVGCTLKIIRKSDYRKIKNKLTVNKSHFQPELMINLFLLKKKIIEIPVGYYRRIGYSKISNNYLNTTILAIKMILLILLLRLKNI